MYYEILCREYFNEASILKAHIKTLKKQYRPDIPGALELRERVAILYGMYLDTKHTGEYLERKCEVMKK